MTRRFLSRDVPRALTPTGGFLRGFAFSLNPYVGCAFGTGGGCPFCYVRALPAARGEKGEWGSWVIAKRNLPQRLAAELAQLKSRGELAQTTIFMSSATDPYQGVERHARLTGAALAILRDNPPRKLLLQTRSPMIERDIDLLKGFGSRLLVSLTLETNDDQVRWRLSPTSPSVARRAATAYRLRRQGICVQLAIAPMMPNDPERFAELAAEISDRVVVDTCRDGDGAGGRRSSMLGMPELYARLGYEKWYRKGAEEPLLAALKKRMGAQRVLWSRAGFNDI